VRAHVPECAVLYSSTNKVYGDLEQFIYEEQATRWHCPTVRRVRRGNAALVRLAVWLFKGFGDQYALDLRADVRLRTVVFRHSSMYGGPPVRDVRPGVDRLVLRRAVRIAQGRPGPITIAGSGKQGA